LLQAVAAIFMGFLTNGNLKEVEQSYMLVVLLRAMKVCRSILAGTDTNDTYGILLKDIQAHLV
jgi:hypothetical protein